LLPSSFFLLPSSFDINSGCVGMISNPHFIVGRKVASSCQQIIRAIFSFLTHSQQSKVNSQKSTITDGATGIDMTQCSRRSLNYTLV
ncbi:MAG: hypothetical protein M3N42_10530, partial [Cyanobacteriota bacterium]|nr:hypothetical protein [Cyanobacteriota bacterium]